MWTDNPDASTSLAHAPPVDILDAPHDAPAPRFNAGVARVADDASPLALMVSAAQNVTRDPTKLIAAAKQLGSLLGADGFYRFPAGKQNVEGPSIDLAQALAQLWGAIAYQVRILSVERLANGGRKVQLRATVTDLKSLVACEVDQVVSTSPPPGKFAEGDQAERWHAMQTQSAASKIVRNAILRVIPSWLVDAAFCAAVETDSVSATAGKSLPEARAASVQFLRERHGLTAGELEAYTGQPVDLWAAPQLAMLRDLAADLKGGRVSVEAVKKNLAEGSEGPVVAAPTGKAALGIEAPKKSARANGAEKVVAEAAPVPAATPES